ISDSSHHGAQLDAARLASGEAECRVAFQHIQLRRADHLDLEEVIHHPQTVEASRFGALSKRAKILAKRSLTSGPGEVGYLQSDAHAASPSPPKTARRVGSSLVV